MTGLVKFVILTIVVIGVIVGLRTLRPKLREQRYRRWEKEGLLPHQVDPYAPREPNDDNHTENGETRR
ncbi:MAG TPA: hypothetical protein VG502_13880 [Flexivirga sp.]|uniref:hypothetical protein n=1 Tax=Flexivirga sp. TaxID=1962927 RepID=UPI002B8122D6|nr:hypothetical protein [Flexivirga sp.]HWC23384.1 hypothetical protein [Flexivirga sp.]